MRRRSDPLRELLSVKPTKKRSSKKSHKAKSKIRKVGGAFRRGGNRR